MLAYDDLFPGETMAALQAFTEIAGGWKLRRRPPNGIPWKADYDIDDFRASDASPRLLIPALTRLVERVSGNGLTYQPCEVSCYIARRGDAALVHRDSGGSTPGAEYTAWIYLNRRWRDDDYGQLQFFDQAGEVVGVVGPRFGRVVLWDSSVAYLSRPPSIDFKQGQAIFSVRLTANASRPADHQRARRSEIEAGKQQKTALYSPRAVGSNEVFDVASHVIRTVKSAKDQAIVVLRDVYDREMLERLRLFILDHGDYYYDDSIDSTSDNVQWIAGFDLDEFVQSPYWRRLKQVVESVSGTQGWFPYDVSCNLVRNSDYTRTHEDCADWEDEWTFVLYLTPDWRRDYLGETVFLEEGRHGNPEYITGVWPDYGGAVIFQNLIRHSARPPSALYADPRLTFAVKMSISEEVARAKVVRQFAMNKEGLHAFNKELPDILFFKDVGEDEKREESSAEEMTDDEESIQMAAEHFIYQHKSDIGKLKQYSHQLLEEYDAEKEVVLSKIFAYL